MFQNLFKVATTVATTAIATSNPLAGIAIQKISTVLVKKEDAPLEEIEKAIQKATPEQLAQIEDIENKFKGIKETTEFIECIILLATFLAKTLKQGMPVDTALFVKLQNNSEFQAALKKASEGIKEIPAEIKDLDFEENINLGVLGLRFITKILKVLNEN
jgi:hypothetical protein